MCNVQSSTWNTVAKYQVMPIALLITNRDVQSFLIVAVNGCTTMSIGALGNLLKLTIY